MCKDNNGTASRYVYVKSYKLYPNCEPKSTIVAFFKSSSGSLFSLEVFAPGEYRACSSSDSELDEYDA